MQIAARSAALARHAKIKLGRYGSSKQASKEGYQPRDAINYRRADNNRMRLALKDQVPVACPLRGRPRWRMSAVEGRTEVRIAGPDFRF